MVVPIRMGWIYLVGFGISVGGCARLVEQHRLANRPRYTLRLAGAQVPTELVRSWAERCGSANLTIELVQPVYKSHYGFKALREGRADLACTSRRIASFELEEYAADGVGRPVGLRVASKAFALYVHPENPVRSLTAGQLKQMFRSTLTTWSGLGWAEGGAIRLYGPRRSGPGGPLLMALAGLFMAKPPWQELDRPEAVVAAVVSDRAGLGFAPIGMEGAVRALGLAASEGDRPVEPTLESVLRDEYILGQVIYLWSRDPPAEGVRLFGEWLFSAEGTAAIAGSGYDPVGRGRSRVVVPGG